MRSAPTLKIWMTPLASVAMLEKLALLKIALCSASALTIASSVCPAGEPCGSGGVEFASGAETMMVYPDAMD
ncbi:MAG: hypothetical protein ACOYLS_05195 [Polymorphobacter sp.]